MSTTYTIFPTPQQIVYGKQELKVTKLVSILAQASAKDASLNKLKETLTACNLDYEFVEEPVPGQTHILLTDELHTSLDLNKSEGYTLSIDGDADCTITITGCDTDGLHYGIVTLSHILSQMKDYTLKAVTVTDYPEILYRGYIEGFYGFPWSHEDRKDLMVFGGKQKLNTYIYAPKDDPYHRSNWRDSYPQEKALEISELAASGHENNLNFVWTIHPGDTIDLDSEVDFQSTLTKLDQLYTLGVRQFGILFDDIGGHPDGAQQAHYINRVDTEFVKAKGDVRPLLTVGTRYCEAWGPSMEKYFKPFAQILHDDVEIMWTGSATMSNVSREQFAAPMRTIGSSKNLSVWWNYPVNDYCDAKMLMGKIENLNADVDNINGFFANPMNQAQASKQALFCVADHNWNTDAYDCVASFDHSFKALAPEVAKELQIFASNCSYVKEDGGVSGSFFFDESWYLASDLEALTLALENGADYGPIATNLSKEFSIIGEAANTINATCKNLQLVQELDPFLDATRHMGQAGYYAMEALLALKDNNLKVMEGKIELALKELEAMEECKVLRLKDGAERYFTVDVGTLRIKPFLAETIQSTSILAGIESKPLSFAHNMHNIALASLGVTATASGETAYDQEATKAIEGTISSGKWCSKEHRPYLTLDLQEVKNIKQYRVINCGHPEAGETRIWNTKALQILTSIDGINFTLVDEVFHNKEDIVNRILFAPTDARYVRLQIIEPAQISINGGGHTRIYGFELFDVASPDQSPKVQPSEIEFTADKHITIRGVNRGDVVSLYTSIDGKTPLIASPEVIEGQESVTFDTLSFENLDQRIFVERTSKNYLPSVRSSKGLY